MTRATVEPLGRSINSFSIAVSATSQAVKLNKDTLRVSLVAVGGAVRVKIRVVGPLETLAVTGAVGDYIQSGERVDLSVASFATIAAIRATGDTGATSLEVTELV